jgi:hypothetical protein
LSVTIGSVGAEYAEQPANLYEVDVWCSPGWGEWAAGLDQASCGWAANAEAAAGGDCFDPEGEEKYAFSGIEIAETGSGNSLSMKWVWNCETCEEGFQNRLMVAHGISEVRLTPDQYTLEALSPNLKQLVIEGCASMNIVANLYAWWYSYLGPGRLDVETHFYQAQECLSFALTDELLSGQTVIGFDAPWMQPSYITAFSDEPQSHNFGGNGPETVLQPTQTIFYSVQVPTI